MDSPLPYATTPLALISLLIIAGVSLMKVIADRGNVRVNASIVRGGFYLALFLSGIANVAYLFETYLKSKSEVLVFGSVVDGEGTALPNVLIDAGGLARGFTSDSGSFVLAIPSSRTQDIYDVVAIAPGYEKALKTIQNEPKMFMRFELAKKIPKTSDVLKLANDERIVVGHFIGLPVVQLTLSMANPSVPPLTFNDFSVVLTSPSGKKRQLTQMRSQAVGGPVGPPLPMVYLKPNGEFSWVASFVEYDSQAKQLSFAAQKALQAHKTYQQNGMPMAGQPLLEKSLTSSIRSAMKDNWFWEEGTTTIQFLCNLNGPRCELTRTVNLSQADVAAMKESSNHYGEGYGVFYDAAFAPVGAARPGLTVSTNGR